jgi:uncharacterized protein
VRPTAKPYQVRTVNTAAWPQFPYDETPKTRERSEVRYDVQNDWNQAVEVRDGTRLLLDVYRPYAPGRPFPALCSFSPYTRQHQRDTAPTGQNEAGLSEFWVPRGYAHVIVDVRGSNGSDGGWDMWGPTEQRDLADVIEWVAEQPWCDGNVGMMGCSYFAMTQNLAAQLQPPSLKAIFPYDAMVDLYRDCFFPGGIPNDGWSRIWFSNVKALNFGGGRNPNPQAMTEHFDAILGQRHPLDGEYYRERSAWPNLEQIDIPTYWGCHWPFYELHLRGAFEAWMATTHEHKHLLIGPQPVPWRPFGVYHGEALRWYDQWLKGMDTGVLESGPIRLWIEGEDTWREEEDWPLRRTEWTDFYLGGSPDAGTLTDTPPDDGEQTLAYDPADDRQIWGEPRWTYRTEPFDRPTEITGPIQLDLAMASTATDTDWVVIVSDEAPDGSTRELTRGFLRSSHRAVDPARAKPNRPWHPHDRIEELVPGQAENLPIEIVPTCNLFAPGHRVRLELANGDNIAQRDRSKRTLMRPARNTVIQGRGKSRINLPIIPRDSIPR